MKIKDTPSWVLPHNVLVKDCLLFFSPIAVWPVDGFFGCVPMGPLGHRCYPNVLDNNFEYGLTHTVEHSVFRS